MHVEVSIALNFVISYLYNKLPRRRVDLLGVELEKGLKKKFEGHWYPDKPFKGSGFRCVPVSGEKVDPVIVNATCEVGLSVEEIREYLPEELTLWIDPNEVSYRIGEKGQIKILYSNRNSEEENNENEDREVQATNRGFNPEAQSFNPDAQSFKPIDTLSASLGNLAVSPVSGGMSPTSPISSASWGDGQSVSPNGNSVIQSGSTGMSTPPTFQQQKPVRQGGIPLFTTAAFAQTKFGSTKLKTNAKRPTRLSPTEFGNYFRQRAMTNTLQHPSVNSPPRSRSLSPRDPRVEFLMDQQQRMLYQNQQHQLQQQFHQQQLQLQKQQQLSFQLQQQQQQQFQQQQQQHNRLNIPTDHHRMAGNSAGQSIGSLHDMFSGPSPLPSPGQLQSPMSPSQSLLSPGQQHPLFPGHQQQQSAGQSPMGSPAHSPMTSLQISPENHKALLDGLGMNNVPYSTSGQYHQLLLAS